MLQLWSLMVAGIVRNPRRSLLTVASVALSLCLLSVLAAAYRSLFFQSESDPAEALRIVTHRQVSITQPMPVSFLPKIRAIPAVRDSMIWQWFGGTYKDTRDPRISLPASPSSQRDFSASSRRSNCRRIRRLHSRISDLPALSASRSLSASNGRSAIASPWWVTFSRLLQN